MDHVLAHLSAVGRLVWDVAFRRAVPLTHLSTFLPTSQRSSCLRARKARTKSGHPNWHHLHSHRPDHQMLPSTLDSLPAYRVDHPCSRSAIHVQRAHLTNWQLVSQERKTHLHHGWGLSQHPGHRPWLPLPQALHI